MKRPKHVGQAIRFVRLAQGMSQEELANKSGVSDTFISFVENGNRTPSWDVAERICEALGVSLTLIAMLLEKNHPFVQPIIPLAYMELARISERN